MNGARRIGRHVGIVRHQDDGDPLRVELLEHPQDFDAGVGIEVARRLVGQDQRGPIHHRSGDGDSLLLPARHLRRFVFHPFGQAHAFEQALGQLVGLL